MPRAPTGLVATEVTATSAHLSWTMAGEELVESFVLQYKRKKSNTAGGSGSTYDEVRDVTKTEHTVANLDAFTTFEFRVLAVNNIGRGLPSSVLDVTTGEKS